MNDPQRLMDGAGDELEIALLAAAAADMPSPAAVKRTLVALGIGGGLVAAGTTAGTAAAGGAGTVAKSAAVAAAGKGAVAAAAGQGGVAVLVKWVGIAAVGGLGAWGVVEHVTASHEPARPNVTAPAVGAAAPAVAPGLRAGREEPRAAEDSSALPALEPPVAAAAAPRAEAAPVASGAGPASAAPAPTLAAEVAALDRARAELDADPEATLRRLDDYERGFADGSLGPEAQVLRIEALARAGKVDAARALGQAFLAHYPGSPHARRVRSILAGTSQGAAPSTP
ncbi:MAG: hypothetical protein HY744_25750 [Deltaproteobacteria bacterium]|nr:hypothetical protein [Deltaproteobacteria bacterium]